VIFIDRGKGIRETLSKAMSNIGSDQDAMQIAFTERILAEARNNAATA
jgi:hypothetical protein